MAGIGFHLVVIRTSQNRVSWADGKFADFQNADRQKPLSTLLFRNTSCHPSIGLPASDQSVEEDLDKPESSGEISGSHSGKWYVLRSFL